MRTEKGMHGDRKAREQPFVATARPSDTERFPFVRRYRTTNRLRFATDHSVHR